MTQEHLDALAAVPSHEAGDEASSEAPTTGGAEAVTGLVSFLLDVRVGSRFPTNFLGVAVRAFFR